MNKLSIVFAFATIIAFALPALAGENTIPSVSPVDKAAEKSAERIVAARNTLVEFEGEWNAFTGSLRAMARMHGHAEELMSKIIKQSQEDAKGRADAESRLKWVLDNWVPKSGKVELPPEKVKK